MAAAIVALLILSSACALASSQQQGDSCGAELSVANLIPFNTSTLISCLSAWKSEDFILRYGSTVPGTWSYVLSAPDSGAYIAVGFSADGSMIGSSAVAGWITKSGPGVAKQYYLGGKEPADCLPDKGGLNLVANSTVIISQASRLFLAFQLNSDQIQEKKLILSVGPAGKTPANYQLVEHRQMTSLSVDYTSGSSTSASDEADPEEALPPERQHALLVLLGWGVLMPVGVTVARYLRHHDPHWFYAHMSIQAAGFALGVAGIAIGLRLDTSGISNVDAHRSLGIAILVMGCLQAMAILIRPGTESKIRRYWNWYHHLVGRAAVACVIANIFFGLVIAQETNQWFIAYAVFLGVWAAITAVLEVRKLRAPAQD